MSLLPACAVLVMLVSCSLPVPQPPGPGHGLSELPQGVVPYLEQAIPVDRRLTVGSLDNGLRYYIRRNGIPEASLELRLVVRAGSVLEADDQQGLAHLLQHMAFAGTERFTGPELAAYLESLGAKFGPDVSAYTGFDETVYQLRVPTDSLATQITALQVLADWAGGLTLAGDQISAARDVVVAEWRLGRGARARLRDQQLPVLLRGSRYAERLPNGRRAVLDTFHHETLRSFYRQWYRPELMAVIAVGDCDPAWVQAQIREQFGAIGRAGPGVELPTFSVPDHGETLYVVATDREASDTRLSIHTKAEVRDESTVGAYHDHLAQLLYYRILNQRLSEVSMNPQPPFLSAGAGNNRLVATKEIQVLTCRVTSTGIQAGLTALLSEARRVRTVGFTVSELEREKGEMLAYIEQVYAAREKTESGTYAGEYTRNFTTGEPTPGIEYEYGLYTSALPKIALAQVNAEAARWNGETSRVVAVSMPAQEDLQVPTPATLRAIMGRAATESLTP
jgi:zinc protease